MSSPFLSTVVSIESVVSVWYAGVRALFDSEWKESLPERTCLDLKGVSQKKIAIWFHAASVGEVNGISPLVNRFLKENESLSVLITTTSLTGRDRARSLWSNATVRLLPLESKAAFMRFLGVYKPKLLVINETELWPLMMRSVYDSSIPMVLVNARISDRAYPRYEKFKFFFSLLIRKIDSIYTQSEMDRDRFINLGASPDKTEVLGSTKFDSTVQDIPKDDFLSEWKERAGEAPVFTAGSVREGEEDIIIKSYLEVRERKSDLKMILAPRHPEQYDILERKLQKSSIAFLRKSNFSSFPGDIEKEPEVILLDTFGDLPFAYSISDFSFVGGTLCPVGGHNILEPASYSCPVIVGTSTMNVRAAVEYLRSEGALLQVKNQEELLELMNELVLDKERTKSLSMKSFQAAEKAKGVTRLLFERISKYL